MARKEVLNVVHTSLRRGVLALLAIGGLLPAAASSPTSSDAYRAMGIKPQQVLSGSVLSTQLFSPAEKQLVAMVTYFTGKREEARAMNVRLEVFREEAGKLTSLYARDFGQENDGYVARGELQLVDLDGDGINEIVLSFDDLRDRLIRQRKGEVILPRDSGFRTAWSGTMSYDATQAARKLPLERRDRYEREVDVIATLRTRGERLVINKTVSAVAGERLPQPKVIVESFALEQ